MSIADDVKTVLLLEAFAAEAKRLAEERRTALGERARAELEQDGIAPSWRLPDVAKVTLGVTKTAAYVADEAKLAAWVLARHPEETERRPRPRFVAHLLANLIIEGESAVDPSTGEIVPGIGVRQGGLPDKLSIRAEPGVKDGMAELVTQMLATAHPAIGARPESVPRAPDDPWIPAGDPFAAFPARGGT